MGIFALVALAAGACGDDEVALFVQARMDLDPGVEVDTLVVELRDPALGEVLRSTEMGVSASQDYSAGRPVADFDRLAKGGYAVRLVARLAGAAVLDVVVPVELSADRAITIELSRACQGVSCPVPGADPSISACLHGVCVEPACVIGEGTGCAEPGDGGTGDAGPSDVGLDAPMACDDGVVDTIESGKCGECFTCSTERGACASFYAACFSDTECSTYLTCVNECEAGDMTCVTTCITTYPAGSALYREASSCTLCNDCRNNCSDTAGC